MAPTYGGSYVKTFPICENSCPAFLGMSSKDKIPNKEAKFERNVFQMGPSVFWITRSLGPLSKSYFASLKLGGQRQHVQL